MHNCELALDTGGSQTSWTVLFILTVLHTVVVISAFIRCQCLAIHITFMHIQSVSVSECHLPGATFKLKDVFFTTEFILNLLCSEVCSLCHPRALCYWNDHYYYFSCQRWTQNVSVLFFYCIPQLFSYNYPGYAVIYVHFIFVLLSPITLSFVLYDGWIKLYCNKTNCHHKHLSEVFFFLLIAIIILLLFLFPVNRIFTPVFKWWLGVLVLVPLVTHLQKYEWLWMEYEHLGSSLMAEGHLFVKRTTVMRDFYDMWPLDEPVALNFFMSPTHRTDCCIYTINLSMNDTNAVLQVEVFWYFSGLVRAANLWNCALSVTDTQAVSPVDASTGLASDVTVEVNETLRGHLEADVLGIRSICGPRFVTDPHIRTGHMWNC